MDARPTPRFAPRGMPDFRELLGAETIAGDQPVEFGPYQVLARLAAGGMANVLLAREPRPEGARLVTIKTILPELSKRPDLVAMFFDEIALANQMDHPHCVRAFASGQVSDTPYLAMEFLLGDTLASLLKHAHANGTLLPLPIVAHIAACVADGLHYIHELRAVTAGEAGAPPLELIHRDVSPQNVFVTYGGTVKILDLGVAASRSQRSPTITNVIKGKLRYMSLEQLSGRILDRRTDIYSLGVVLFEALTAQRFINSDSHESTVLALLQKQSRAPSQLRPDIPEALDEICVRALSLQPDERYSTAKEMADALRAVFVTESSEQALYEYLTANFNERIVERQEMVGRVLDGQFDLSSVRRAFDARRALSIDIHAPTGLESPVGLPPLMPDGVDEEEVLTVNEIITLDDVVDESDFSLEIAVELPVDFVSESSWPQIPLPARRALAPPPPEAREAMALEALASEGKAHAEARAFSPPLAPLARDPRHRTRSRADVGAGTDQRSAPRALRTMVRQSAVARQRVGRGRRLGDRHAAHVAVDALSLGAAPPKAIAETVVFEVSSVV